VIQDQEISNPGMLFWGLGLQIGRYLASHSKSTTLISCMAWRIDCQNATYSGQQEWNACM